MDGNDVNLVVAMVFRVAIVLFVAEPFEIIAGLDVRRGIEMERLMVVAGSVGVFIAVAFARAVVIPEIVRRVNDNLDGTLAGRSVLFDRVTFNRDVIAVESTFLDGIFPIHPRLARRFSGNVGARTANKQTN